MCHNPFFLKLPTVTAKKNPAEVVTKNKRFLILTHNKKWPQLRNHIKDCWKQPESAAHLSWRARGPSDRRRSLSLDKFIHYSAH